jgi:hypothetical protein
MLAMEFEKVLHGTDDEELSQIEKPPVQSKCFLPRKVLKCRKREISGEMDGLGYRVRKIAELRAFPTVIRQSSSAEEESLEWN